MRASQGMAVKRLLIDISVAQVDGSPYQLCADLLIVLI